VATVVISPFNVANFPEGGGHFWVYLQYALGLCQLGCEVYWLESLGPQGDSDQAAARVAEFTERLDRFGLGKKYILYFDRPLEHGTRKHHYINVSRSEAEGIFRRADLLLNFHYAISPELLSLFRRTALVDIDPGLLQFWMSRRQLNVPRHDLYFTTGETVGAPAARVPDCGVPWIYVRPPVSLEYWPYVFEPRCHTFTTVSTWDSSDWVVDGEAEYENTKRVAFLEFADLPRLTSQPLELALFLCTARDMAEWKDLQERGWRIRQSRDVTATPEMYQAYIQSSRGEFGCAKPSCLRFQNAWISDRTLCYLASGKPVVVQHTGPSSFLPNGEGLFRFSAPQEAAESFSIINSDYERHCRAARDIAETFFDSKRVIETILNRALA
jgi:hypothetical protein